MVQIVEPKFEGNKSVNRVGIPKCMEYLRHFAMASSYVPERKAIETKLAYKRRSFATLHEMNICAVGTREMRIHKLAPNKKWNIVWENVHCAPVHGAVKAVWYKAIHDIVSTNAWLHKIRIAPTDKRFECGMSDTIEHRLIECGEGQRMWEWTQMKIAMLMRASMYRISRMWLKGPQEVLWPPTRRSVMWMIANMVLFRVEYSRTTNRKEYTDFIKERKQQIYLRQDRSRLVANYLCVVEQP
jgi:hypothetical protein